MTAKPHGAVEKAIAAGQAAHNRLCASSDPVIAEHAKATGYLTEREPLTITEALVSMRDALDSGMTPRARGALSDLEDATRRLQAADPTAAILRFLRAEEARFDRGSEDGKIGADGRERCRNKASALRTAAAYIERGDHVSAETERTPEVVLRAMLRAYETAALEHEIRFERGEAIPGGITQNIQCIRECVASVVAKGAAPSGHRLFRMTALRVDYEARLSGETPLDAPPAK